MNKATFSLWASSELNAPYIHILGFLCVFFHCFSIYLNGKGGKGVASAAGVLLFFSPYILCTGACTWLVFRFLFKKASVASLVATTAVLIHTAMVEMNLILCIGSIGLLILFRHKENIIRLHKKQERYF
jgi:acyl phosphate:glycerol-3-phosphate acyltransferase